MFKAQKIYQAEFSQVSHYHYNLKLQQMFHFKYVLEICKGQILKIFVFIHHFDMKFYHVNIPIFTPHKYLKKIAELKIVVDIKTIEVQRLYLISKQEGASGKKTRNKHSLGCIYKGLFSTINICLDRVCKRIF